MKSAKGFSLIELLLVVVIVGLIATVSVPSLTKARDAADNAAAMAKLRAIHTSESNFRFRNFTYARLPELNTFAENAHGTIVGSTLRSKEFTFVMFPNPTDASLKTGFQIIGYRVRSGRVIAQFNMTEDGSIRSIIQ
ncbi:MAG: prepilin-type N-terminal cleavage/methylation domain-containing protein [Pyrinomonadaceae bacterium]